METDLTAVAHVIQMSVAPVFLVSGIGAMLAVMTNRLSRVIDRSRALQAQMLSPPADAAGIEAELLALSRRAKLVSTSITLCTITAILICTVIVTLFLGAFLHFDAAVPVAVLFIGAMLTFILGLVW